jgi:SSS family solute:Na+ symporter
MIAGAIAVVYTVRLEAVIYTDTIRIILMAGIVFIGIPISYNYMSVVGKGSSTLPQEFFSLRT